MHTHICAIFHNGTRTCLGVRESPSVDAHVARGVPRGVSGRLAK